MPFTSSTSRKVRKKSRMPAIIVSSLPPDPQRRLHPRAEDQDPDYGDRDEHFPAEPHDLVVAIARKRCAGPDKQDQYKKDLGKQPMEAADAHDRPRSRKR